MNLRRAAATLGVVALLALVYAAGGRRGALEAPHRPPGADAPHAAAAPGAPAPDSLPASLRGSEPGGGLALAPDGHFAPTRDALALFDYYFAASGEEPDARIEARIRAEIAKRLPPPAAAEADAFFAQYLAYRASARELFAGDAAHLDEDHRFQRIRELRRAAFGAELAAQLFGEEESVVLVDLETRRLAQDTSLSPEERARRIAAAEADLPEEERAMREQVRAVVALRKAEAELRAAGADDAAIRAERERRFGADAAARLHDLDVQRRDWDARVGAYRAERNALRASGLPPDRLAEALTQLRDSRFSGPERVRIEALEKAEVDPSKAEAAGR